MSAVALDPAGARLITGSYDYEVSMSNDRTSANLIIIIKTLVIMISQARFWDFAAMDAGMRSFRTIVPQEG